MHQAITPLVNLPYLSCIDPSITRQMAGALGELKRQGKVVSHLGGGYPSPESSQPVEDWCRELGSSLGSAFLQGGKWSEILRQYRDYTDTMGPQDVRRLFAEVYGSDFGVQINPDALIPTVGGTGGIDLVVSLFASAAARSGERIAVLTDGPTYPGMIVRAIREANVSIFSVGMDEEGPIIEELERKISAAKKSGYSIPFYYTVPDGHNPGGISFSQRRREEIYRLAQRYAFLIVEDQPYNYIRFDSLSNGPSPFMSMDPDLRVIHLFTASKIWRPGPRVALCYAPGLVYNAPMSGSVEDYDRYRLHLKDLLSAIGGANYLQHSPEALYHFSAYLTEVAWNPRNMLPNGLLTFLRQPSLKNFFQFKPRSLWPEAERKTRIYQENRDILLGGLEAGLGQYTDRFHWTTPGAGFFSVFTDLSGRPVFDGSLIAKLISEYGVMVIPMQTYYPRDAREENPEIGLNQVRLCFSFTEEVEPEKRRRSIEVASERFTTAIRKESGLV